MIIINKWYEAYLEIAKALDTHYQHNQSAQNIYRKIENTEYFNFNNNRLGREEGVLTQKGLDPIQIFATFNYNRIKHDDRVKCINYLFKALETEYEVDHFISFEGVPAPIIAKIIRYRGWSSQNQIWDMFHKIVEKGIDALEEKHFNSLEDWSGIDIASLTIFLFWINSEVFLPLDKNTVRLLKEFSLINKRPQTFGDYFDVCFKVKLQSEKPNTQYKEIIRNFVKDAYGFIKKENTDLVLSGSTASFIVSTSDTLNNPNQVEQIAKLKKKEYFKGFRIIALKPKEKPNNSIPYHHLKNLQTEDFYTFYSCFEFKDVSDQTIIYHSDLDLDIYSYSDENKNINITISSIVGKNGSGKSSLIELIYLVINKLALYKGISPDQELENEEVYADLYIKSDNLYKISVGNSVEVFEYNPNPSGSEFDLQLENKVDEFDIESFCYTLVVNYSLYGLNSKILGTWINPLFHKNDSYNLPIVLNPMRDQGNIDVNKEEYLAKSRLLANLLDPQNIDSAGGIVPELVPNSTPKSLHLSFDMEKMNRKRKEYKKKYRKILTLETINKVLEVLHIDQVNKDIPYIYEAREYIYYKLVGISEYPKFNGYKKMPNWINKKPGKLEKYLKDIFEEDSHITFKLRQAINYLKYGLYTKEKYDILELSQEIDKKQEEIELEREKTTEKDRKEIRAIELVPPSFFEVDIKFTYDGNFAKLSSGEKQQILSINTIAYHLYNLDSVAADGKGHKYNCVNIVFDEIELYFHPEMQRTFIKNLRERIISLDLNNIDNINIIFVTHSPFILSDLPKENVLKLRFDESKRKSVPEYPEKATFGSNIHELLTDNFFLNLTIGEYAKEKINEIISLYTNVRKAKAEKVFKSSDFNELEIKYHKKRAEFEKISKSIGEDFLQGIIQNHIEYLNDVFPIK